MNTVYVYASPEAQAVFAFAGVLLVVGVLALARGYP